jgi:hypothetical protein
MGIIVDTYKEYLTALQKLNALYQDLQERQKPLNNFLAQKESLFAEREQVTIASITMEAELRGLIHEFHNLETQLRHSQPGSSEEKALIEHVMNKKDEITVQEELIVENHQALVAIEHELPWVVDKCLAMEQLEGVQAKEFDVYLDTVNEVVTARCEVMVIQDKLRGWLHAEKDPALQSNSDDAAKRAWAQEKAEGVQWGAKNTTPLVEHMQEMHQRVSGVYSAMREAYNDTAQEHLNHLGNDKYKQGFESGKFHLGELEAAVLERRVEQTRLRSLLPAYVTAEIPMSSQIQDTSTLYNLKAFLEAPLNGSKERNIDRLQELFSDIGLSLPKQSIHTIYSSAIQAQKDTLPQDSAHL